MRGRGRIIGEEERGRGGGSSRERSRGPGVLVGWLISTWGGEVR